MGLILDEQRLHKRNRQRLSVRMPPSPSICMEVASSAACQAHQRFHTLQYIRIKDMVGY